MVNEPLVKIINQSKNLEETQIDFRKLFFLAGVSSNGIKIFVLKSDNLLEFESKLYDAVYKHITKLLLQLSEAERFIIVFFASDKHQATPWSYIISHYYKLDQRLRKNLDRLYIVHPSSWSRFLFQAMNMVISQKFLKKLVWIESLRRLASEIPLGNLSNFELSDSILERDNFINRSHREGEYQNIVFEFPTSDDSRSIPSIVRDCCKYIQDHVETEGIFRLSGSKAKIDAAIVKCNLGIRVDMGALGGVHGVACLLKQYFRDSSESIFPHRLIPLVLKECNSTQIPYFLRNVFFPKLPQRVIEEAAFLFQTLYIVHSSSDKNRMTAKSLALIWTPNFLKNQSGSLYLKHDIFRDIVETCIEDFDRVFHPTTKSTS